MEGNPDVDEVVAIPRNVRPAVVAERYRGAFDLALALAPLRAGFRVRRRDAGARGASATPTCGGIWRALTARLFLTDASSLKPIPNSANAIPRTSCATKSMQVRELVRAAGGAVLCDELVVPIGAETRARVAHVPEGAIAVHLAPRWLAEGSTYESLVALLWAMRRFGRPVVVTHGPEVAAEAAATARGGRRRPRPRRARRFDEWAAAFERAAVVVTVDTGATHVASAMHRPTLVLFERRYFALSSQEWAPYRVPSVCLRKPAGDSPADLAASREEILAGIERLLQTRECLRSPSSSRPTTGSIRLRYVIPALLRSDLRADQYELVVADSNSNDGTAEYLAEIAREHPNVRHLPGPYTGRAMARNAGIDAARADIVLFTDADIIASPDLLSRHLERHKIAPRHRGRRAGIAGRLVRGLRETARSPVRAPAAPPELAQASFVALLPDRKRIGAARRS